MPPMPLLWDRIYSEIIDISQKYNSVLVTSLSKFPGLAGSRLGFITGNEVLINKLRSIRPMYEIGALQARILELSFENWNTCLEIVNKIKENKLILEKLLKTNFYEVLNTFGNFTLFRLDPKLEKYTRF